MYMYSYMYIYINTYIYKYVYMYLARSTRTQYLSCLETVPRLRTAMGGWYSRNSQHQVKSDGQECACAKDNEETLNRCLY